MRDSEEKIFRRLGFWDDPVARDGPGQMACDEALVRRAGAPVLRIFRWSASWVSAGYFIAMEEAKAVRPDLPVCRRWTGGGIVVHEGPNRSPLCVRWKATAGSILRSSRRCGKMAGKRSWPAPQQRLRANASPPRWSTM